MSETAVAGSASAGTSDIRMVGDLARLLPPVSPALASEFARDRFVRDEGLLVLPVVGDDASVVGILNRFRFLERFASRFGRELAARKPVETFVETGLVLDAETPIDEVGNLLVNDPNRYIFDGFVVTRDGRYAGVGTGFDIFRALTERRHADLQYRAHHDSLTGLPNRDVFESTVADVAARTHAGRMAAILFIDLDRFKEINDTFGHRFGDLVLCAMASRLRGALRRGDLVARLSGDEFAAILEGLETPEEATRVARVLVATCAAPLEIDGHIVSLSCSVGIALLPAHATTAEGIKRAADAALYGAKEVRNCCKLYMPDMQEGRAPVLAGALRQAIEHGTLNVHYQPVVCLQTGLVTGVEALVRWTDPIAGQIPAYEIVKLAEDSGLIVELGAFVLETSVRQMLDWDRQLGSTNLTLAVNVSAVQIREGGLVARLDHLVASTGFPPHRLDPSSRRAVHFEVQHPSIRFFRI